MEAHYASVAAAAVASFFRKHPPKEWIQKMGPVGVALRKNPKVWVGAGVAGVLLLILLFVHSLSDKPKAADNNNPAPPAAGTANVPAQNPANPNPQANPGQLPAANPAQNNPAPNPVEMAIVEAQAYQAAEQKMAQNAIGAQFPQIGNPNVQITPQDAQTFIIRSLCQGFYVGRGYGVLPWTCTVHRTADGQFTADDPQY
jgi:hypothetical protein